MLGLGLTIAKASASVLTYVKDNLKLYLDFKSSRSDTLAFPSEGSTSFDSGEYILFSKITFTDAFTIGFWFKGDTETDYKLLLKDSTDGSSNDILVKDTNGQVTIRINGAYKAIIGSTPHNTWCHLVFTRDASGNIKSYLNGVASGTQTSTHTFALDTIGYSSGGAIFNMANLGMWTRELSLEEVNSVMNKSYSQLGSVEKTSLVSWWALDTETLSDNLATAWTNASADAEILTTNGANITSLVNSSGHANLNLNAFATRYRVYKVSYDYTLVSGTNPQFFSATGNSQDGNIPTSSTFASLGSSWYFTADTGNSLSIWSSSTFSIAVDNFSVKAVISADSHGSNTGYYSAPKSSAVSSHNSATTTTSVYGGNAPVLPRAIDIAESQAEAIGDGSASFTIGNTDYIEIKNTGIVLQNWTISFWVRTGASLSGDFPGIVSTRSGTNNDYEDGVTLHYYDDYFDSEGASCTSHLTKVAGNTNLDDGKWHHIVFTSDRNGKNKQYINGIFITEEDATDNPTNADIIQIGARFYGNTVRDFWDGNISQVGIWQGALSQSQVQSLMESTSYAKIPASVKSTLGSEIADTWVNNSTYPFNTFTTSGVNITSGIFDGSGVAISYISFTAVAGKLYKATMNLTLNSGNAPNFRFADSDEGGVGSTGYVANTLVSGTNTFYWKADASATRYFMISINTSIGASNFSLSNLSLKEVTNDLVAYYPLDADSSNTVKTDDLVGGETLGSNFVDDHQESHYSHSGTTMDNITNGVKFTYVSDVQGGYVYLKGASILSGNLTNGNLYKATFNAYYEGGSSGVSVSIYQGSGSDVFGDVLTTSNAEYSIYFIPSSAHGFIRLQNFASSNIVYFTNLEIQEVTSNTGVLK